MSWLKGLSIVCLLLGSLSSQVAADRKKDEPATPLDKARRLATDKKYSEALGIYKTLLGELDADELEVDGVNHIHIYREMARTLAKGYQQVHVYLRERMARAEKNMLAWENGERSVAELTGLQRALGLEEYLVDLYDRVKAEKADHPALEKIEPHLFEGLLKRKRYQDIHNIQNITERIEEAMDEVGFRPRYEDLYPITDLYQVLCGLERKEEAAALVEQVLEMEDSAETYNNLARAGYMSGKTTWETLELAREAHKRSEGRKIQILDTLARCLIALGHNREAMSILEKGRKKFYRKGDLMLIDRILGEVKPKISKKKVKEKPKKRRSIESQF